MVGRHRNPLTVVLLSIVTLGIYLLYWIYISFAEVRAHRGKGTSGIVGLLLALIPVSIFLLPSHVGDMYAEAGKTKPITGTPGSGRSSRSIGGIVWLFKVQNRLNEFWAWPRPAADRPRRSAGPAEPAPAPAEETRASRGLVEGALAALEQGNASPAAIPGSARRAVRLVRRLVVVDLEDEERGARVWHGW